MNVKIPVTIVCYLFIALMARADWRDDYEVEDGFQLDVDAQGFEFPTSIAFVQEPGNLPDSPLYFVTEIRGRVKVVTNDQAVEQIREIFLEVGSSQFQKTHP